MSSKEEKTECMYFIPEKLNWLQVVARRISWWIQQKKVPKDCPIHIQAKITRKGASYEIKVPSGFVAVEGEEAERLYERFKELTGAKD